MENSDSFNFEKFIMYLESVFQKMPAFGNPRSSRRPKTLLPYEMNQLKLTTLPRIGKQKVEKSNWKQLSHASGIVVDKNVEILIKDFMITKEGEHNDSYSKTQRAQSGSKVKLDLQFDPVFQTEMQECLYELENRPGL